MTARQLIRVLVLVVLGGALLGCRALAPERPTPTATAAPQPPTVVPPPSPVPAPTATATPTPTPRPLPTATPTPMPIGYLELDGERVVRVVLAGLEDAHGGLYALTERTLFRLWDGIWERVGPLPVQGVLVAAESNPEVLYLGDHPPCFRGGEPVPFYRSRDGGVSWEVVPAGENVRPVLVSPADPRLVVGDRCGLFLSSDGGDTWHAFPGSEGLTVFAVVLDGSALYAVLTAEGGTSWLVRFDVADPGQLAPGERLLEFWGGGAVAADAGVLLVAEPRGVHRSADGGLTWTRSRSGIEEVTVSVDSRIEPIPLEEIARGYGLWALAIDPGDAQHLWLGTVRGLYDSSDGGTTWRRVVSSPETLITGITVHPRLAVLLLDTPEGIFVLPRTG